MPRTVPKKDRFFGLFEKLRQPDITGHQHTWGWVVNPSCGGALYPGGDSGHPKQGVESSDTTYDTLFFAASRANGIHGKSDTVQPSSLRLMAIIKA